MMTSGNFYCSVRRIALCDAENKIPVTEITDRCPACALHFRYMLNEKQFRDRARTELRQIGSQVCSLATDRDVYRKLERDVIQPNPQLRNARSAVLDMIRGAYTDALALRLRRLLGAEDGGASLPRVLEQLADYPQLLHDKITEREFAEDRAALDRAVVSLRCSLEPHFAHHERTLSALTSAQRELDRTLDFLISTVKTYYWIVAESYIDLDVKHSEDPLSIFGFAWATATLAKQG